MVLRKSKPIARRPVPKCRSHGDMVYHPEDLVWRCANEGCPIVKRPPLGDDSGRPVVLKGRMEAVMVNNPDGLPNYYLRAVDSNVLVKLDNLLEGASVVHTNGEMYLEGEVRLPLLVVDQ